FRMRMLNRRRDGRGGPALSFEVERMISLEDAPAVVLATMDQMRRLPEILAVGPDPDVSGFRIRTHSPWISQSVGPDFRASVRRFDEGIVGRCRVGLFAGALVDVDSQDAAEEVVERLTGIPRIRVGRTVAGGDVEHAVETERHVATVVSGRFPLDY